MKDQKVLADVLMDVAPGIVVFRKEGKWLWHGRPGATKEDVIKELEFQMTRSQLKRDLMSEALEALKSDSG